jgi:hypothetical protein
MTAAACWRVDTGVGDRIDGGKDLIVTANV